MAGAALRHRDAADHTLADAFAVHLTWPDAVTCLGTAARFHDLPVVTDGIVHAVVPYQRDPRFRLVPERYALPDADVIELGPLRITGLERTLFDCLGLLPARAAEELLIWVLTRRIVEHAELVDGLERRPGAHGNGQRRALLRATRGGAMGAAEVRLHRILDRAGITGWLPGEPVYDHAGTLIAMADALFPRERLVVEVDGKTYHGETRFQSDRTRQNRLVLAGYTVLRFTWEDLVDRPTRVARQIEDALRGLRTRHEGARP